MDREQMRTAILKQEQTFRHQVHELHRVYHVQKQLMREMQMTRLNRAQAIVDDVDTKPELELVRNEKATSHHQFYSLSNGKIPASADECNLELTLATGSSSSSSGSRGQKGKQAKSSNSDSGTAVSSTSTESELAQFKEFDVTTVRFQSEGKRLAGELSQSPWLHQCLSLRMA